MVTAVTADELIRAGIAALHSALDDAGWLAPQHHRPPQPRLIMRPHGCLLLQRSVPPQPGREGREPTAVWARADYCAAVWLPCRASCSSFSPSLDREVFSTVPPNLLIASTALSGVTFSTMRNSAEVPGFSMSRT